MTMGDRIKYLRESSGLTQDQLGEMIGVQKSAIRKYEKGEVENIKRSAIKTMADYFGVSPCFLMWGTAVDEKDRLVPKDEPKIEELIRLFSSLPEDAQEHILGILRTLAEAHQGKEDRHDQV